MYGYQQPGQQQQQQQQQFPPGQQPPQQGGGYPAHQYGASQQTGYGPPYGQEQGQPTSGPPNGGALGGLTQGMAGMGIQDGTGLAASPAATGAPARHGRKKKDRHAHHEIEQAHTGAPQGFSPMIGGQQTAFPGASPDPSQQYAGQQGITPAMNQFPARGGTPFATGARPPMESGMDMGGSGGRVDPEQIPSVPRARDTAELYYREHMYLTMEQHVPPPAAVPYVSFDQGNSSPRHARLTLNSIPSSADGLAQTALPLGLVLQPFAPQTEGEQPIPVLDFKEAGPPRCRRCRTYINPFMQFRSGGNKFVCNMCTFPNDVPQEYFAPTDPSGIRVDREERPELRYGTVEFLVPKEYWVKEPVGIRWLFLIDVSMEAVHKGLLAATCSGILESLYGEMEETEGEDSAPKAKRTIPERSKVGFVTFDRDVHFYNCHASRQQPEMMIMPDIEDPFVPLGSDGLFSDPYESKHVIEKLLHQLPEMFAQPKPQPALLPALNSALGALENFGGKIICSISCLPTEGPGKLTHRDNGKLHGIDTEKKLFQTESAPWRKTASDMVKQGVGVDFFMAAPGGGYMDLATIGHVSAQSGGEVFYYPNWHAPRDAPKVSQEIKHILGRETGYQALLKVRCSNGLQVNSYHGNFVQHTFGADLEFGTVDADKAVGVMFSYDGKLDPKLDAHFQSALLYTTSTGERRVRCTNTVASVNEGGSESMRFIDQDAVVTMIAKEAATRMTERTLKEIRGAITEKSIDILAGYRKAFSRSQPSGQLVLPENLKEFGMYTLSLLKSKAFKAGAEPSDKRTHAMRLIRSGSPLALSLMLYPRIISLHNLESEWGFPDANTGHLVIPPSLRASFSKIEEGGAYLVDDGQTCLLWLHSQVSPNLLEDLFGEGFNSLQALDPNMSELPVLQTHLNAQVRNLIAYWSTTRTSRAMTLQLARQGLDGAEYEFARLLLEDRNAEAQSYVDWLVHVHRGVQGELSGQRKKESGEGGGTMDPLSGLRAMGW